MPTTRSRDPVTSTLRMIWRFARTFQSVLTSAKITQYGNGPPMSRGNLDLTLFSCFLSVAAEAKGHSTIYQGQSTQDGLPERVTRGYRKAIERAGNAHCF